MHTFTVWLVSRLTNSGWDQAPEISMTLLAPHLDEAVLIAEVLSGKVMIAAAISD